MSKKVIISVGKKVDHGFPVALIVPNFEGSFEYQLASRSTPDMLIRGILDLYRDRSIPLCYDDIEVVDPGGFLAAEEPAEPPTQYAFLTTVVDGDSVQVEMHNKLTLEELLAGFKNVKFAGPLADELEKVLRHYGKMNEIGFPIIRLGPRALLEHLISDLAQMPADKFVALKKGLAELQRKAGAHDRIVAFMEGQGR